MSANQVIGMPSYFVRLVSSPIFTIFNGCAFLSIRVERLEPYHKIDLEILDSSHGDDNQRLSTI